MDGARLLSLLPRTLRPCGNACEAPAVAAAEMPAEMPAGDTCAAAPPMGMGMMGGMGMMMPGGRRGALQALRPEAKYDPTAWGRYAKVLLSSSEFLYIN